MKVANNATSTLAAAITASATTLSIQASDAAKFPAINPGETFPLTLVDSAGNMEICKVTVRAGSAFTVVRGQESTVARSFPLGAKAESRLTAAVINEKIDITAANAAIEAGITGKYDKSGGVLTGPVVIDVNGEALVLKSQNSGRGPSLIRWKDDDDASIAYVGLSFDGTDTLFIRREVDGRIEINAGANGAIALVAKDIALNGLVAGAIPPGVVLPFAGPTVPAGFLKANGALVSRTAYAALFSAIGTTYGAGNGSTTFKLPDYRGEFIRGWDDGRGADPGRALGTYQDQSFLSHAHYAQIGAAGAHQHKVYQAGGSFYGVNGSAFRPQDSATGGFSYTSIDGDHVHPITVYESGGPETRPRNVSAQYIIRY